MRYVAAYLLAVLGGKDNPNAKDIKKILSSVGIDADDTSVNKVISELERKSIPDLISQGREKLASVPSAGAVAVTAGAAAAPAGEAAPEEKKEEKKEESEEESDDDMGFGLFD